MASEQEKKAWATDVARWYAGMKSDTERAWGEALLAAALDETNGDPKQALELAKAEHAKDPTGDD
jgi:hypothetical protein